ncbi:MAG: rhomboid family intramembrane serine protease [Pseudomonadota bacterium]
MSYDPNASPIIALPPAVILLVLGIVIPEALFAAGNAGLIWGPAGIGLRQAAVETYGFYGQVWGDLIGRGTVNFDRMKRFATYPFVHLSFTQAVFGCVFVLALGKFVGEQFRGWAVIAIFFFSSLLGAIAYGAIFNDPFPLVGAFAGAYGLIGAFTYLLAGRLSAAGGNQMNAFQLIGILMAVQLLFALLLGTDNTWVADLAGFAGGFLLSSIVRPGGWAALIERIRRD